MAGLSAQLTVVALIDTCFAELSAVLTVVALFDPCFAELSAESVVLSVGMSVGMSVGQWKRWTFSAVWWAELSWKGHGDIADSRSRVVYRERQQAQPLPPLSVAVVLLVFIIIVYFDGLFAS